MRREEIVEESDSTDNPSINGRYHRFNVKLGKGAFKEVYKAFDTHEQIDVAWNSIDLSLINTEDEKKKIWKECEMLRRLNHPNILKITNQWFNDKTDKLCFITNIVHDGSLAKFFRKRQVNLLRVKQISKQILEALNYLHANGVIHRDLKCDNIFIEGNTGKVVLGDLGLSCNVVSARSIVGTPHWMAPELYREDYDEMVDIWSFGMCVLELITSLIPYSEVKGAFQVYQNITAGKKPQSLTKINDPYVRAFINICLNVDRTQRPSANELLDHPFLYARTRDTTLCSELMKPKNTEPVISKEEKQEEEILKQSMLKPPAVKKKNKHTFNKEPASSPPPPSNSNLPSMGNSLKPTGKIKRDMVSVKKVKNHGDNIKIKLQIVCSKFPKPMNVEFDFSHRQEKPSSVAMEMTRDLELPNNFTDKVEKAIKNAITKAKKQAQKQLQNKGNNNDNDTQNIHKQKTQSIKQKKQTPPMKKLIPSKSVDKENGLAPKLETRSRKSASFNNHNGDIISSPNNGHLNTLQTSVSSLTASIPSNSPLEQNKNGHGSPNGSKQRKSDPMYAKPVNRTFGFNNEPDYLTNNNNNNNNGTYNMPMIRNQSSPDPPLSFNGYNNMNDMHHNHSNHHGNDMHNHNHSNHHGNDTRESLSNPLDDISSIGSVPQPNTATNSHNGIDVQNIIHNIPPNQLTTSQSLPQQPIYNNNMIHNNNNNNVNHNANHNHNHIYMNGNATAVNTMYNANNHSYYHGHPHTQSPTSYHTQQLASHSPYMNVNPHGSNSVPNTIPQQTIQNQRQRGQSNISNGHNHNHNGHGHVNNVNMNTNMQRSTSQQSNTSSISHTQSAQNTPKLPPVPEPKTMHAGAMLDNVHFNNMDIKHSNHNNVHSNYKNSISPPKSTTPPTPPPVIGIQDHNDKRQNEPLFQYNHNNKSRSTSPGPQLMHRNSDHSQNKVKDQVAPLSDGLIALQSLNNKSSDTEIFRVTLKLTLEELIQEFVKRNKSYNKSEGKNGLARKLVNILKEEVKHISLHKTDNISPITDNKSDNLALPLTKKETTPDSVFSAKSTSVESQISMETAEKLSKKRDSGRENVLKLRDCDSGGSNGSNNKQFTNIYDNYTNKSDYSQQHNRTGTAVIHPSYSTLPNVMPRQLSHDKKNTKSAHTLAPSGGYGNGGQNIYNGHNGHISNYSSASNNSTISGITMNTTRSSHITMTSGALSMGNEEQYLPSISTLKLPFDLEELKLPSPNNEIIFDSDVLNQISTKQLELHNEYIDFVKRKYELLQLRYATLEAEYKDNNPQQIEIKTQEELNMKDKINKKRSELTDKFAEWLSDREQIAQLKSRIEKKRSTSNDKLPTFDVQLEFENDPQFISLMKSQLNDNDKRKCKMEIQNYRKQMMDDYRKFYLETLQIYKDKELKQQQM